MAKKATIYHNPKCSTSRQVLEMIEAVGYKAEIVEYVKTGWTKRQLKELFAAAGVTARQALRTKAAEAEELRGQIRDELAASRLGAREIRINGRLSGPPQESE